MQAVGTNFKVARTAANKARRKATHARRMAKPPAKRGLARSKRRFEKQRAYADRLAMDQAIGVPSNVQS